MPIEISHDTVPIGLHPIPIHHIHYITQTISSNDALVAGRSPKRCKSLLLEYLQENPFNHRHVDASMPKEKGYSCREMEGCYADKERVIKIFRAAFLDVE
jgi:hypothetical protein